jgi:hypothetical protein
LIVDELWDLIGRIPGEAQVLRNRGSNRNLRNQRQKQLLDMFGKMATSKGVEKGKSKDKSLAAVTSQFHGYRNHFGNWRRRFRDCRQPLHSLEDPREDLGPSRAVSAVKSASKSTPRSQAVAPMMRPARAGSEMTAVELAQNVDWLFAVNPWRQLWKWLVSNLFLLSEFGAFDHVCPKNIASWLEVQVPDVLREVVGFNLYGTCSVTFELLSGGRATMKFSVMNVMRPILSVSRLVQKQFLVVFGRQAFLERDGNRVALVRFAGL